MREAPTRPSVAAESKAAFEEAEVERESESEHAEAAAVATAAEQDVAAEVQRLAEESEARFWRRVKAVWAEEEEQSESQPGR